MIGVRILGHNQLFLDGLAALLDTCVGVRCLGVARDVEQLSAAPRHDVVVVDHRPEMLGAAGREPTMRLCRGHRVVVTSVPVEAPVIFGWAESGARGMVTWDCQVDELVRTIEAVARGHAACSPQITSHLLQDLRAGAGEGVVDLVGLTPREQQIADLLDRGLSNKEIARRLDIAVPTVKNHVHNLLTKLDLPSRRRVRRSRGRRSGPRVEI